MTQKIGIILLAILLILMALGWFGVSGIPPVLLGILASAAAVLLVIEMTPERTVRITSSVGMIFLSIILILMALLWWGVTAIPTVVLGVLAIITAIFLLIGR